MSHGKPGRRVLFFAEFFSSYLPPDLQGQNEPAREAHLRLLMLTADDCGRMAGPRFHRRNRPDGKGAGSRLDAERWYCLGKKTIMAYSITGLIRARNSTSLKLVLHEVGKRA
ncbi:hypothetical protein J3F84DRAFT_356759 [Trichoderma pleuroticola]